MVKKEMRRLPDGAMTLLGYIARDGTAHYKEYVKLLDVCMEEYLNEEEVEQRHLRTLLKVDYNLERRREIYRS